MPSAIEQYKNIQQRIADKKAAWQSLVTNKENLDKAVAQFGQEEVNKTLGQVQQGGVGIQNTTTGANIAPPPEPTPWSAMVTPPAPTPPVEPIKAPEPVKTETAVQASTPVVTQKPPEWFQYSNQMDAKTGMPTLIKSSEFDRQKKLETNKTLYANWKSIFDWVKSGSLIPWSQDFADLQTVNPNAFAEYQAIKQADDRKNAVQTLGSVIVGEEPPVRKNTTLESLVANITGGMDEDIATSYKNAVTNNPEYIQATNKVNAKLAELADVNNNLRKLGEDVRKKYSADTPESLIASAIARDAKPLIDQAQYIQDQVTNAQAEATRIFDNNKEVFWLQMQERTDNRNLAFKLYDTINADEIRQEDIMREDDRIKKEIALEEYRYQRELADGNVLRAEERKNKLDDLRIQDEYNMKNGLLQLGVDPTGMTPEEMKANYAGAVNYQNQLKAQEANKPDIKDFVKSTVTNEDGSTREIYTNPFTGQTIDPQKTFWQEAGNNVDIEAVLSGYSPAGQELLSVPDGTVIPTRLGEVSPQNAAIRWKECAEYVNDIAGTKMGSSYSSKQAVCNEPTGWVGSIVAWKPTGSGSYGHTGIIVNEDENNWYVKSSNYVPGTVTTEKIPKEKISNFYTPDSVKQATQQAQETQQPIAKKYANWNVRTSEWILYDKKEVSAENQKVINNDSYKALKASESLNREWQAYKALIDKYGIEAMPWKARSEMQSAYERVMRQAQTFFNLWVLQKLDEEAVQRMIPKTARWMTDNKYLNPFERDAIAGQVKQVDEMIKSKLQGEYDSLNTIYGSFWDTLSGLNDVKRIYNTNIGTTASDVEEYTN